MSRNILKVIWIHYKKRKQNYDKSRWKDEFLREMKAKEWKISCFIMWFLWQNCVMPWNNGFCFVFHSTIIKRPFYLKKKSRALIFPGISLNNWSVNSLFLKSLFCAPARRPALVQLLTVNWLCWDASGFPISLTLISWTQGSTLIFAVLLCQLIELTLAPFSLMFITPYNQERLDWLLGSIWEWCQSNFIISEFTRE